MSTSQIAGPFTRRRFIQTAAAAGLGLALYEPIWANDATVPDTLFVTWFDDPTTTMAIQWLEQVASVQVPRPVDLQYKTADGQAKKVTSKLKPMSEKDGIYVHRVELTGLNSDTVYRFNVVGSDSVLKFQTAPSRRIQPIVVVEGGDSIGEGMIQLHQHAAKWNPLFAINGGDIAFCNGRNPREWFGYLQAWHRYMVRPDGVMIPMVVCPGNHECSGGFFKKRDSAPYYYSLFDGLYKTVGYNVLDFGDYLSVILLDSDVTTPVGGAQATWLDQTLTDRKDVEHRLVVYHVPAYPSHRSFKGTISVNVREHWVPLFEKHNIPITFEHHDHTFKRTHKLRGGKPHDKGVTYLGDGAWGRGPRSVDDRDYLLKSRESFCLNRLTLDKGKIDVYVIDEKNKELDRFTV